MSDADNQVGGTGEPFSKRDQGDSDANSPDEAQERDVAGKPKEQQED